MKRMECAGSEACSQLCLALQAQGVAVQPGPEDCSSPDLFVAGPEDTVTFRPAPATGETIENPRLVRTLGAALFNTLQERQRRPDPELVAVSELIASYQQELTARETLWQRMLQATRQERQFTPTELAFYREGISRAGDTARKREAYAAPHSIVRARAAFDHRTLREQGLLFDDQMLGVVDRVVGNLMDGKPTLVVGDKGVAKTNVALYVARLASAKPPILISGHGDMMSNELVGQPDLVEGSTVYRPGGIVQGALEARPVIFDEINLTDPDIAMRIQQQLLLRPGDTITLQEDNSREITIPPGFGVIATANEDPLHYTRRRELDTAFRDRFDKVTIGYPDDNGSHPLESVPRSNLRLALASAVDDRGELSPHTPLPDIEILARLARITQHLYTIPAANVPAVLRGSETHDTVRNTPLMTDCITPRVLADTIRRCAAGNKPGVWLSREIDLLVAGLDQGNGRHNQKHARRILSLLRK